MSYCNPFPTPYTLAEIQATPEFSELLALGLEYAATPRQEADCTVMFAKNGLRYMVYVNGYVRRGVYDTYMNKFQLNPVVKGQPVRATTLEMYRANMRVLVAYLRRNNL
jgi:hypothetical protein